MLLIRAIIDYGNFLYVPITDIQKPNTYALIPRERVERVGNFQSARIDENGTLIPLDTAETIHRAEIAGANIVGNYSSQRLKAVNRLYWGPFFQKPHKLLYGNGQVDYTLPTRVTEIIGTISNGGSLCGMNVLFRLDDADLLRELEKTAQLLKA